MAERTDFDYEQDLGFYIEDGAVSFVAGSSILPVPIEKMDEVLRFVDTIPNDLSAAVHLDGGLDIATLPHQFDGNKVNLIIFTYRGKMLMLNITEFKTFVDEEASRVGLQRRKA